jgi:hypothetical protein
MTRALTKACRAAKFRDMNGPRPVRRTSGGRAVRAAAMLMGSALTLSGCISVNAPDKPIVIELNINIKQEVVYRLARDAGTTIESNPEIF